MFFVPSIKKCITPANNSCETRHENNHTKNQPFTLLTIYLNVFILMRMARIYAESIKLISVPI